MQGTKNITVRVVGQHPRGHIADLLKNPPATVSYKYNRLPTDLRAGKPAMKHKSFLSFLAHNKLANILGIFLPEFQFSASADIIFSVNRFCVGSLPLVIWLERPAAPVHYEPSKLNNRIARYCIKKIIESPKTAIVCWSKACFNEFLQLYDFVDNPFISVISPMVVPPSNLVLSEHALQRQKTDYVKLLFVGSLFHVKGGKEAVIAFEKLALEKADLSLTIVSDKESIGIDWLNRIMRNPRITFINALKNREEMWRLYDSHQILIHPTLYDSYGLVLLEAIRVGIPVISTNIYAIPEIIGSSGGILLPYPKSSISEIGYEIPRESSNAKPIFELADLLFNAIKRLLDKEVRLDIAYRTLEYGNENFGEKIIHDKWLNLYHKLLQINK